MSYEKSLKSIASIANYLEKNKRFEGKFLQLLTDADLCRIARRGV